MVFLPANFEGHLKPRSCAPKKTQPMGVNSPAPSPLWGGEFHEAPPWNNLTSYIDGSWWFTDIDKSGYGSQNDLAILVSSCLI